MYKKVKTTLIIGGIAIFFAMTIALVYFYFVNRSKNELTYDSYKDNKNMEVQELITERHNLSELRSGNFYIWQDPGGTNYKVLASRENVNVFKILSNADNNFDYGNVPHVFWYNTKNDIHIPTMYEDDVLIYVNNASIPYMGINWQRFADYGYTIGIIGLTVDRSGHYHLTRNSSDTYLGRYYEKSDASSIKQLDEISEIFLDKVGGVAVRDNNVTSLGTVANLTKNVQYVCEWYTGSFYQDFKMTANTHIFGELESFVTYEYTFMHSDFIVIKIPSWLKTGYYYINGKGFFRYVSNKDKDSYNGKAYDEYIDWNVPIIIKDEDGRVIYDPTTGTDYRYDDENNDNMEDIYGDSGWEE